MRAYILIALGLIILLLIFGLNRWREQNDPLVLLHALGRGNVDEVKQLIQRDPQLVNQTTLLQMPPLAQEAEEGNYAMAQLLLDNHADINARVHFQWGKTALHLAAQRGDPKMVELLLEHHADVNARDDRGFTPIIDSSQSAEVIKLLLAHGANINAVAEGPNTVFSQVINNPSAGSSEVLRLLLDHGVDVTVGGPRCLEQLALSGGDIGEMQLLVPYYAHFKNPAAQSILVQVLGEAMDYRPKMASAMVSSCLALETSPLHRASIGGDEATVRSILSAHPDAFFERDEFGWTPLHLAAMADQPGVAEALLSNGADRDAQDALGHTALGWAAYFGHDKVVEVLLRHQANMNLVGTVNSSAGWDWNSPLDFAIQEGFTAIALRLIAAGANVNSLNSCAAPPLHFAAMAGNPEIIGALLEHGARIDARISTGKQSPLDYAVVGDSPESVRLLIEKGASVQTETYAADGGNLFHVWACSAWESKTNPAVADQLLAADCAVNGKDAEGKTPLDVAIVSRQGRAVQWLLDHQAEVNTKDKEGLTPLHYAAQQCDIKAVQLLLDRHAEVNAKDNKGRTPLNLLQEPYANLKPGWPSTPSPPSEYREVVKLLLAYGAI